MKHRPDPRHPSMPTIPETTSTTQAVSQDLRDPMPLAYNQHQYLPCRCSLAGAMNFQPVGSSNSYFFEDHVGLKRSRSVITHDGSVEERPRQTIELDSRYVSVVRPDGDRLPCVTMSCLTNISDTPSPDS